MKVKKGKWKQDASTQQAPINNSQKHIWVSGSLLLANFLEIVVNELWEGHLQRVEEIQTENIWQKNDCLDKVEESFPAIHWTIKKLITLYSYREKLISWALKILLKETSV